MSKHSLSVLVIGDHVARTAIIEAGLRDAGYRQVAMLHDMQAVGQAIKRTQPDIIVIDLEHPNNKRLDAVFELSRRVKRPIVLFVDNADQRSIQAAVDAGISAYIVNGLRQERVKPIVEMAISRFESFSRLQRELDEARSELAGRKMIDQAKSILMTSKGLTEPEAYALLRKTAMDQNRKIADIAQSLVTASKLLD